MPRGALPPEILKLVFKNLVESGIQARFTSTGITLVKVDLKTCLSVCKSWQSVAQEFFKNTVNLMEDSLPFLLEDISYFGDKLESISVGQSNISSDERESYSLIWCDILLMCPNLISVSFDFADVYHYLHVMVYSGVVLEFFQRLNITELSNTSNLVTRKLYLEFNVKHLTTITELTIVRLDDIPNYEVFDDFIEFIAQFPNLTVLNLIGRDWISSNSNIDIHKLSESVPHLKKFKIREFKQVSIDLLENEKNISKYHSKNWNISSLDIQVLDMDMKTVKYIAARSKKVDLLDLDIQRLILEESPSNRRALLKDLKASLVGIKSFNITYYYCGYKYLINNDICGRVIEPVDAGHDPELLEVLRVLFELKPGDHTVVTAGSTTYQEYQIIEFDENESEEYDSDDDDSDEDDSDGYLPSWYEYANMIIPDLLRDFNDSEDV